MSGSAVQPVGVPSLAGAPVLAFKRHLRAEVSAGKGAYLFSEQGVIAMRGARIESLAPLLDGTRELGEVLRARPDGMAPEEVAAIVTQLLKAGLVSVRPAPEPAVDERELAYWDACGVDAASVTSRATRPGVRLISVGDDVDPDPVERALADAALEVLPPEAGADAADLNIVLCTDYLDPRLGDLDAEHRLTGRPWLLARPFAAQVWIGPVLRPGESACWHCLTSRLWGHRHAEACAQELLGHEGPARRPAVALPSLTAAAAHLIALEVRKWLAGYRHRGQDSVWVLDTLDLQGKLHELRRRPQCPGCGDTTLMAAQAARPIRLEPARKTTSTGGGHRTATPAQTLDRYRHLVSPITGIIAEIRRDPAAPPFVNAYRSGFNVARGMTGMAGMQAGLRSENGGKGVGPIDAEVGALCEAVERFSGNFQGDELRIRASLDEIGPEAVHPNDCMLFAERQYLERDAWNAEHGQFQHVGDRFDPRTPVDWTPVWSLSGRRRLLPTAYLYYGVPAPCGRRGLHADSNGAAAGSCLEDAVLQGTLELVERDAVALWWYNRTPVAGVDLGSFGDSWLDEMTGHYAGLGRQLWVLDVTSDLGVPVFVAVTRRTDGPHEHIMFGFGAHLDPRTALRRAVTELNQMLPAVLSKGHDVDDPDAARWLEYATVANQPYLRPAAGQWMRRLADFDFVRRADVRDDVTALDRTLATAGVELLVLDQSRPDLGLPVVKVLAPGLRPFWARYAPGRLFDVPVRLGRLAAPTPYERLNPCPMFL
ncbi:TOMM precursor leader peptide-binding protein [Amycolatopsis sp. OK19-0408]|uniref:TOMM leader peptide-binding protein n=1 Tax=Amycolatopsis iheyensis TaxID=2945988 RepID=A0A9X2SKM1_9PSEU|nr:TOMM precursor leader peptide-binding protein [Amycolatopsis iheyensis]MCR6483550.1 TOMM precursor leader peptide-binding protein [Amycolatopsis iheyensis]